MPLSPAKQAALDAAIARFNAADKHQRWIDGTARPGGMAVSAGLVDIGRAEVKSPSIHFLRAVRQRLHQHGLGRGLIVQPGHLGDQ